MKLIVALALIISGAFLFNMQTKLPMLASKSQIICQEFIPLTSKERASLASLVCGQKVTDPLQRTWLQKSGLIHIFVVSGSHLLLISFILENLRLGFILRTATLLFFTFITGWQAPCVRSLVQTTLTESYRRGPYHLKSDHLVFFAGFLSLLLFPNWIQSLSLQLSWCSSLALNFSSLFEFKSQKVVKKSIVTAVAVYLLLLPLLSNFGGLHPLSIFWNLTLGNMITVLLFPLASLAICFTFLDPLFHALMTGLWWILASVDVYDSPTGLGKMHTEQIWIWILGLHFCLHFLRIYIKRNHST